MPGPRLILLHLVNPVASARQPCSSVSSRTADADAAVADAATPAPLSCCCCITCHCLAFSVPKTCLLGGQILGPALGVVLAVISPLSVSSRSPRHYMAPPPTTLTPLGLGGPRHHAPRLAASLPR
ncbi:hypothetical protein CKAH01_05992 [Colletotrichum kahawae]|uniref:Secreted protein n=1 Tax=Colletotrichum kahawae TaxID=34407 RepID=A0AAE0D6N0_COLKA|nr:hypothetical protein CKAH01_05992 [Colletotrichum kahawae]